jgi:hypothetical protein
MLVSSLGILTEFAPSSKRFNNQIFYASLIPPVLAACSAHRSFQILPLYSSTALVDLGHFFSLLIYIVSRSPWTGDQPIPRTLPTHKTTERHNKRKQKSMPWVGFESITPAFERAKAFYTLDQAANVIGISWPTRKRNYRRRNLSQLCN